MEAAKVAKPQALYRTALPCRYAGEMWQCMTACCSPIANTKYLKAQTYGWNGEDGFHGGNRGWGIPLHTPCSTIAKSEGNILQHPCCPTQSLSNEWENIHRSDSAV
uniref:Uncharacterized protein n=1 Tax=Eutreptiella gymnastica TaxID=73025 RepID=A0A7S4GB31_9EUGL